MPQDRILTDADVNAIANAVMRKLLRTERILLKVLADDMEDRTVTNLDRYMAKEIEVYGGNRHPDN